jgi:hypothetical protein
MDLTSTLLCLNQVQEQVCVHFPILFGTVSNTEDTLDENPQCSGSLLYLAIIICCFLLLLCHVGGWLDE